MLHRTLSISKSPRLLSRVEHTCRTCFPRGLSMLALLSGAYNCTSAACLMSLLWLRPSTLISLKKEPLAISLSILHIIQHCYRKIQLP